MKKSLFASIIAGMLCASAVFAEKGGGYLGIDIGHGNVKFDQYLDLNMTTMGRIAEGDITADNSMANIAIKGGYKTFFGESKRFGVRGYVYFGYGYSSMQNVNYDFTGPYGPLIALVGNASGEIFTNEGKGYYTHVFDYGVGGDLLFNFIDAPEHSLSLIHI